MSAASSGVGGINIAVPIDLRSDSFYGLLDK
jgi:hypothetical protein